MNSAETEMLISLVKRNPCLYDPSHEDYKQIDFKEAKWIEIANTMNKDFSTIRLDWKKLRDCHRDAMKRRLFPQNDRDAKINRKWKYEDQMEFLLNFMTNKRGMPYSNDSNNTTYDDNNENSVPHAETYSLSSDDEPPNKLTKSTKVNSTTSFADANNLSSLLPVHSNELANELELFFSAMCATTKRLPVRYQIQIKKEIFKIVTQSEEDAYERGQL